VLQQASYTTANITVDADGRITAASSGSAGSANPAATKLAVFAVGGGGGAGGPRNAGQGQPSQPGNFFPGGASGKSVLMFHDITAPFSSPWQAGAGGTGGPDNSGQDGQDTYLSNVVIAGGGTQGGWNAGPHATGTLTLSTPTDVYYDFNTGGGTFNVDVGPVPSDLANDYGAYTRDMFGFSGTLSKSPSPQGAKPSGSGGNPPGGPGAAGVLAVWENIGPT
jgi:hypothetical protein